MSWPPKTVVFYDSEFHNKSFEAVILCSNAKNGMYNVIPKKMLSLSAFILAVSTKRCNLTDGSA